MKTIASYPAYDVVDLEVDVVKISAEMASPFNGTEFCIEYKGKYNRISPNCIQYYSAEMGKTKEQIDAKLEKAKETGEPIYWLNNCATSITSGKKDKDTRWLLKVGQIVEMAGQKLEIVHIRHEFFGFKEI